MSDINNLSSTCYSLRQLIYGPIGLCTLSLLKPIHELELQDQEDNDHNHNNNPIQLLNHYLHNMINNTNPTPNAIEQISLDTQLTESRLNQQRQILRSQIISAHRTFTNLKDMHQALWDKLHKQKTNTMRLTMKKVWHENRLKQLKMEQIQHKNSLKQASEGFQSKLNAMDQEIAKLNKENHKLQAHKILLVNKIKEGQSQLEVGKKEAETAKQALRRIKGYLLYKEL